MSQGVLSKKRSTLDKKIEEFCQGSSELLANIHERCSNGGSTGKAAKRKRKKKTEKSNK